MNKFQKVACKMAKLERDSGKLDLINDMRLTFNKTYGTNLKAKTFRDVKNAWYNAMKRKDVETIQSAYWCLESSRKAIQFAKEIKMF